MILIITNKLKAMRLIKTLYFLVWFSFVSGVQAADRYNPVNNQLTIPQVAVGETVYKDVVITVGSIIKVVGGLSVNTFDSYNSKNNQLTIPLVYVGDLLYTNVIINVGDILQVNGSTTLTKLVGENKEYYVELINSVPDLTYAYKFYDINSKTAEANVQQAIAMDMNGDGKDELVLTFHKGVENAGGKKITTPCESKIIVLSLDENSIFKDVTPDYIKPPNSIGGCIRKAKKIDVNNDGKLDIIYAINQEDGRSGDLGSLYDAQLGALISDIDGKYKIENFGEYNWYHSVGTGKDYNGNIFITGGGFIKDNKTGYTIFKDKASKSDYPLPYISANAFEFLSTGKTKGSDLLVATGYYDKFNIEGYKLVKQSGIWEKVGTILPNFVFVANEQFLTYSNDLSKSTTVVDFNGIKLLAGGGFSITESCTIKITPNSPKTVIMKMELAVIKNYIPGKVIIQNNDITSGIKLVGIDINEDRILNQNLEIEGEVIDGYIYGYPNFECFDINGDGYEDIIGYPAAKASGDPDKRSDAQPYIYLNQKNGKFKRFTTTQMSKFQSHNYIDVETSLVGDFDGDGIKDVITYPLNTGSNTISVNRDIKLFKGIKRID